MKVLPLRLCYRDMNTKQCQLNMEGGGREDKIPVKAAGNVIWLAIKGVVCLLLGKSSK